MSGGKGGSTTSAVTIPEYIEAAAQRNLNKAERISQIGYTPYYGPDVAAFTPMQQAAFQNTADTAGAFGMAGAPIDTYSATGSQMGDIGRSTAGSAFPIGMSQQDIMGGMGPATQYDGGVSGYSAAPIYEQALQSLAQNRPGQKSYIDSFFIDPYTGMAGTNNFAPIDYTQYGTMADQTSAQQANDLAIAQAQAGAGPQYVSNTNLTQNELDNYATTISPNMSYNPATDVLNQDQRSYVDNSTDARIAQEDINSNILGNANNNIIDNVSGIFNKEPTFDDPSSAGSYGGSLVTGGLSGDFTPLPGIAGNIADSIIRGIAPGYAIEQQGKDFAASGGSTYDPNMAITNLITGATSTGGYDFDPAAFSSGYGNANFEFSNPTFPETAELYSGPTSSADMPDTSMTAIPGYTTPAVQTVDDLRAPGTSTLNVNKDSTPAVGAVSDDGNWQAVVNPGTNAITRTWVGNSNKKDNDSRGGSSSSGDDCVVATHAVNSGAFSPTTKREAVVWCMNVLHGKWWGEAIRRGYRHLGRSKIEQGKAAEHYQEFRNYIAFATGKKRTFKGALHFAARTVQFLAVGLVKKDV